MGYNWFPGNQMEGTKSMDGDTISWMRSSCTVRVAFKSWRFVSWSMNIVRAPAHLWIDWSVSFSRTAKWYSVITPVLDERRRAGEAACTPAKQETEFQSRTQFLEIHKEDSGVQSWLALIYFAVNHQIPTKINVQLREERRLQVTLQ